MISSSWLADANPDEAHPKYISIDGFDPSPSGYVQLASYFWQAIKGYSITPAHE